MSSDTTSALIKVIIVISHQSQSQDSHHGNAHRLPNKGAELLWTRRVRLLSYAADRSLAADVRRFGTPTEPWEDQYDYPQLWGTRRIGPICRANSTSIPATGNSLISTIRGSSCATRLCLRIRGCLMAVQVAHTGRLGRNGLYSISWTRSTTLRF